MRSAASGRLETSRRLSEQLRYVSGHVPFYRGLEGAELEQYPIVTKTEIRHQYGEFISDDYAEIRLALAAFLNRDRIADGGQEEVAYSDEVIVEETSGSSGTPFRCAKTLQERIRLGMGIWRQRRGIDPVANDQALYRFMHNGLTRQRFNIYADSHDFLSLKRIYDGIGRGGYRWIHVPPSTIWGHVRLFKEHDWRPDLPDLKFIECAGEYLRPEIAEDLRDFFDCTVLDQYGLRETWTISLSCVHGFHAINDQNVHVEIVDDVGNAVDEGTIGRIVVTSLQARLLPMVRLATGDHGQFVDAPCECFCGRALHLIEGRDHQIIAGLPDRVIGDTEFGWVAEIVRREVDCHDLTYLKVVQTELDEFVVQTNRIRQGIAFARAFEQLATRRFGRAYRFRHTTLDEHDLAAQKSRKPGLFRREYGASKDPETNQALAP